MTTNRKRVSGIAAGECRGGSMAERAGRMSNFQIRKKKKKTSIVSVILQFIIEERNRVVKLQL